MGFDFNKVQISEVDNVIIPKQVLIDNIFEDLQKIESTGYSYYFVSVMCTRVPIVNTYKIIKSIPTQIKINEELFYNISFNPLFFENIDDTSFYKLYNWYMTYKKFLDTINCSIDNKSLVIDSFSKYINKHVEDDHIFEICNWISNLKEEK